MFCCDVQLLRNILNFKNMTWFLNLIKEQLNAERRVNKQQDGLGQNDYSVIQSDSVTLRWAIS